MATSNPPLDNDTPPTRPAGDGGVRPMALADEEEQKRRYEAFAAWENLKHVVGPRLAGASFSNYEVTTDEQRQAVAALEAYLARLPEPVEQGENVLLYGPTGTGKDHLLVATARRVIASCPLVTISWTTGADFFGDLRACFSSKGRSENDALADYTFFKILVVSDPVIEGQPLTRWQREAFYRLIDTRWRKCRPTWVSMNVQNAEEADRLIGPAACDRLTDGATVIRCCWPSYRKPRNVVTPGTP